MMLRHLTGVVLVLLLSGVVPSHGAAYHLPADGHGISSLGIEARPRGFANVPRPSPEASLSRGVFLVAHPRIRDPRFSETVILLVEYDRNGALGLIINRPTDTRVSSLLPDIEGLKDRPDTVRYGGPVSMQQIFILVRSPKTPEMAQRVFRDVYYSTSRKLLDQMLSQKKEGDAFLMYAGYAGWAGGQLENELRRGDWGIVPADAAMIFDREPSQVWHELTKRGPALQVRSDGNRSPALRRDAPHPGSLSSGTAGMFPALSGPAGVRR